MPRGPRLSRRDVLIGGGALLSASAAGCHHRTGPLPDARARRSLATPAVRMRQRYDVVVVGSGYGASIMAARLAGGGRSLCLLERGKEWLPGDFPETRDELPGAIRIERANPFGLFEFNVQPFADLDVVTGCGLGGTSLINAAIGLRPEVEVFQQSQWPTPLRRAALDGTLAAAFTRAERALRPEVWAGADHLARVQTLRQSVEARGQRFGILPLAIHRGPAGYNELGGYQEPCLDCGNCCSGCNVGAKNTLPTNYLPLARSKGAELYVGIEVLHLERRAQGWRIHYLRRSPEQRPAPGWLDAAQVVLGAGSVGSTEILLRTRAEGLRLSSRLGRGVSANGDVLGFSYANRERTNIQGRGCREPHRGDPPGPALVGYGDFRGPQIPLQDRFLLLDGNVPSALTGMVGRALASWAQLQKLADHQGTLVKRDLEALAPGDGALNHSMLFLACGHDRAQGRYVLEGAGRPRVEWPELHQDPAFRRIEAEMEAHAILQGGVWLRNPRSTTFGGHRYMATHPLGGCAMGEDSESGVVDHASRVFDSQGSVHPGLYVVDAAIIPRSLGVPPLLTIAALAERAAELFPSPGVLGGERPPEG